MGFWYFFFFLFLSWGLPENKWERKIWVLTANPGFNLWYRTNRLLFSNLRNNPGCYCHQHLPLKTSQKTKRTRTFSRTQHVLDGAHYKPEERSLSTATNIWLTGDGASCELPLLVGWFGGKTGPFVDYFVDSGRSRLGCSLRSDL